jgi:putative sigma-54 modulation protein
MLRLDVPFMTAISPSLPTADAAGLRAKPTANTRSRHRAVSRHPEPVTPQRVFVPKPWKGGSSMNLTISGHHLEVTPALREYVVSKLDRVTRHFDQVVDINVLLTVEKQKEKERRQRAEVTLHVKGRDIFVEQSHEDLYAAIDQLMDKLDRQVCRHKEMLQAHNHASAKRLDVGAAT